MRLPWQQIAQTAGHDPGARSDFQNAHRSRRRGSRGNIVGVYLDTNGIFHGFLLAGDEFRTIDVSDVAGTFAFGINPRGDIVGSYCEALPCGISIIRNHGFLLRKGEFASFDLPGAQTTRAFAINPRGDIAGTYRDTRGKNHAFLITSGFIDRKR